MLTTEDAAFLDDLEERIPKNDWSDEETLRLWGLTTYQTPPAGVRWHYTRSAERKRSVIHNARAFGMKELIARMSDQSPLEEYIFRKINEKANP
jgi:hypothetical protein